MRPRTSSTGSVSFRAPASRASSSPWARPRSASAHEAWVPVPAVASIVLKTQVLSKARKVAGALAVRVVFRDGIGCFLEACEAFGFGSHEVPNAFGSALLHAGSQCRRGSGPQRRRALPRCPPPRARRSLRERHRPEREAGPNWRATAVASPP